MFFWYCIFQPSDADVIDRFISCARQAIPYFVVRGTSVISIHKLSLLDSGSLTHGYGRCVGFNVLVTVMLFIYFNFIYHKKEYSKKQKGKG